MNDILKEEQVKGYTIKIYPDDNPINPRENSNLGIMLCMSRSYILPFENEELRDMMDVREDIEAWLVKHSVCYYPVWGYIHSGVSMYAGFDRPYPFDCRWDSGQFGWIYASKDAVKKEYSVKRITDKLVHKVQLVIKAEVEEYNKYLNGEAYGFVIEKDGSQIDSVWGFDDMDYCLTEARSFIPA